MRACVCTCGDTANVFAISNAARRIHVQRRLAQTRRRAFRAQRSIYRMRRRYVDFDGTPSMIAGESVKLLQPHGNITVSFALGTHVAGSPPNLFYFGIRFSLGTHSLCPDHAARSHC
jgi:predicted proteasome-type protease